VRAFAAVLPEWCIGGAIVGACVLVFANTLHNTYALDDFYRLVDNPSVQRLWPPWHHFTEPPTLSPGGNTQYRPLLPLSLSIDYAIAGNNVVAFHVGNLILQIVASLLAFLLALELLGWSGLRFNRAQRLAAAGSAALLFGIHPVSGIAVNYISARDLLLMQIFFLGGLLCYARMTRLGENARRWQVVLGLLALSMLARGNLVVAPFLILAFDTLLARDSLTDRGTWTRAAIAAAVVLPLLLVTQLIVGFADLKQALQGGTSPWFYGLTQARLHLFHYLPHVWWPFSIRLLPAVETANLYDYRAWAGLAFIIMTLGLAWWLRRRAPLIAFCILVYWILMIPESSVVPLPQTAADYRPYAANFFLFLAIAVAVVRFLEVRRATVALAVFTLYAGATGHALNRQWRTSESLWSHSANYGGNATAHMNFALSIADRSDPRVTYHLGEALRLSPNDVLAHFNLCLAQVEQGNAAEGLPRCLHAVQMEPSWPQSHYWLAAGYRKARRPYDALRASTRATQLSPDNLEYHYQAALDAQLAGEWRTSLEHTLHIRARALDYKDVRFVRGVALQMLRRNEEAIAEYRQFLATTPDNARVNFNLAYALMTLGRCQEAVPYYRKAIALQPTYAEAHFYLERCTEVS
jgi:tetratricopeptide (TPR) repeat protein